MVSHLHFDHLGGITPFHHVAMIDLPQTRADVTDGLFTPGRYEFGGIADKRVRPSFQVSEWIKPGETIDLGGRRLQVLSTPGHTPSSVSLYDAAGKRLFTGDYIYPTTIYAFGAGASRSAYHATAQRLLATIPPDTILWTAHCCRADEGVVRALADHEGFARSGRRDRADCKGRRRPAPAFIRAAFPSAIK